MGFAALFLRTRSAVRLIFSHSSFHFSLDIDIAKTGPVQTGRPASMLLSKDKELLRIGAAGVVSLMYNEEDLFLTCRGHNSSL